MDDDEIKIDKEQLTEQYHDEIIKNGEYAEVKILIKSGSNECIPSIKFVHCGTKDVAFMIASLKGIIKSLKQDFPMAAMLSEFADIDRRKLD